MHNFLQWLQQRKGSLGKLFIYAVVVTLAIVVIGASYDSILHVLRARPVATTVWVGIFCILAGMLLPLSREPWWKDYRDMALTGLVLLVALGGGIYFATAASFFGDEKSGSAIVRIAIGWCLAYFAGGFFVGFLFGIPRVLQGGDGSPNQTLSEQGHASKRFAEAQSKSAAVPYQQRVNTNLEQISDWLTKIIVGLGLVELRKFPDYLYKASQWMAMSFSSGAKSPTDSASSFACSFIVFFSVVGFLAGYLITRLYLAGAFGRADRGQVEVRQAPYKDEDDATVKAIQNFWKPGGRTDPANEQRLLAWLKSNGIQESLVSFLAKQEYSSARDRAVTEIPIN